MRVSVIIPVYDQPEWAERALAGAVRARPYELIVVVNGGDHRRLSGLAAAYGATVVAIPARVGPAVARNLGAGRAGGDILFFVDADVVIPANAVEQVADAFARDPSLAAVIGSYDAAPADPGFFSQYRNLLHHWVHQTSRREAWTFWGGCGAVRRQVFLAVGGFDESYREPAIEDIELGSRLVAGGHRILLVPSLQVTHLKRWTLANMVRTDLLRRAIPWTRLILRGGGLRNDLNVRYRDRVSVALLGAGGAALAAAAATPAALSVTALCLVLLLLINLTLYGFFARRRGWWFAARAVPAHWLYLLLCGVGFLAGAVAALARGPRRSKVLSGAAKASREAA